MVLLIRYKAHSTPFGWSRKHPCISRLRALRNQGKSWKQAHAGVSSCVLCLLSCKLSCSISLRRFVSTKLKSQWRRGKGMSLFVLCSSHPSLRFVTWVEGRGILWRWKDGVYSCVICRRWFEGIAWWFCISKILRRVCITWLSTS